MGGARGGEGGVGGGWCVCFFLGGASGCVVVSVGGVVLLMLWDWVGWGGLVRVISYIVVITSLLYRFYCHTFSYIHTSFFSYGAGSLFYVRGLLIVHFEVMVSRDSVESTSCLVSQGLTVPCGGSGSRSPPRLARSLSGGFFFAQYCNQIRSGYLARFLVPNTLCLPWRFNPSTYANARAQVITMGQIQSPEDRIKFSRPVTEARYHSCRLIVGILQERKGGERFVHQEVGGSPCEYISVI